MAGCVPLLAAGQTLPIQLRVAKTSSKIPLSVPFQTNCLPTYGGYGSGNMENALEAVLAGRMSVHKAIPNETSYYVIHSLVKWQDMPVRSHALLFSCKQECFPSRMV